MIPLAVPNLTGNERKYLNDCIDTTFVSSVGEYVNDIEKLSAEKTGTKYGVATSAGTTALHMALMAVGVSAGDIVIIPSFTFIATANSVAHAGAMPWLIDVDRSFWTLDLDKLEKELETETEFVEACKYRPKLKDNNSIITKQEAEEYYIDYGYSYEEDRTSFLDNKKKDYVLIHKKSGRRVAAIMPVYTLGNIPDMDRLKVIADKYGLPIVADAAAAIGSTYKGRLCGEMSDLTCLSFNGNKTVTSGGGGMIVGDDEGLMRLCKHVSTTARVNIEYDFDMVGYNYRMTNIQAAVGVAQLERLEEFIAKKREIRKTYNDAFLKNSSISVFKESKDVMSCCWFSGIVLNDELNVSAKDICAKLNSLEVGARTFWKPVHLQRPYLHVIRGQDLSVSDSLWSRIITLPCSTGITDDEVQMVIRSVLEVL